VGLFAFDLVAAIFGDMSPLSRIIYILLGLAALYIGAIAPSLAKRRSRHALQEGAPSVLREPGETAIGRGGGME
jgi:uncharacterized membrane protein YuzA (DUF378 family)